MLVLHVNDYKAVGGAERVMEQTVALLRSRGIRASTFTAEDIPGHRLTPWGYVYSTHARRVFVAAADELKPDVVHLHNYYHTLSPSILDALAAMKRTRPLRVVMTAHDYHLVCPNSGLRWYRGGEPRFADADALSRWSYLVSRRWDHRGLGHATLKLAQHVWNYRLRDRRRVIDEVLCPSRFVVDIIRRAGLPTRLVPNPVDAPTVAPAKPSGPLRVVFAGRVEPEKGLAEFLRAVPTQGDWTMDVVGEGSALAACRAACAERSLTPRVTFHGRLTHAQTQQVIASHHLLVLPSLVHETAGLTLIEAMSLQTNVLACNLGGMSEIVNDSGVGYLVEPRASASLADAWSCIQHAHAAGTLNTFNAHAYLARHSADTYASHVLAAYRGSAP